jgi:hypothetical protein
MQRLPGALQAGGKPLAQLLARLEVFKVATFAP